MTAKQIIKKIQTNSPLIMGILNVTPDSFSDGGKFTSTQAAVKQALTMIKQGAMIIDIGGESSRPGAKPVNVALELSRIVPVIKSLRKKSDILISIDTYKPEVAAVALQIGANIVNDISGLRDPLMIKVIATENCPVVLMHMQGTPGDMQKNPRYKNVVKDISKFFKKQINFAKKAGIDPTQIILDPGIGFGKTLQHNLDILDNIDAFKKTFPNHLLLVGASRKSFIQKISGTDTADRLPGTLASHFLALQQGADILRVHDVAEHNQLIKMHQAIYV
ncbi:MAG: dihydropteroate synthase [bacterium]|nr:dihydropteroate synthase [bacterium]